MTAAFKYFALASATAQQRLAYRSGFLLNQLTGVIWFLATYYLWQALFSGRGEMAAFTWPQLKTYLILTHLSHVVIGWSTEWMLAGSIRDGSAAMDLLKPVDYQIARFSETLGAAGFEATMTLPILIALAVAIGGFVLPPDAMHGVLATVSFALGLMVKFGIVYISSLFCFWTTSGWGVIVARHAISNLFSGALVPLAFLPGWLQSTCAVLPFKDMLHTPVSVYLGRLGPEAAVRAVIVQAAWALALWLAGRALWRGIVRTITINGG